MGAGDRAAEQSRLAAERVARLKRRLDQAERDTKPWDSAAVGEREVADRLSQLIPHGWYLLHDVHWPGRPKANLDHVLVGPGGVVVVDAKNWTGEVRVSSGVLWQGRYSRTQSVEGALAQCAAVTSVLAPPHRRFARPLICMATQPDLFGITSSDVAVAGTDRVVDVVLALPEVLDQQTVVGLYAQLGEQLTQEQDDRMPVARPAVVKPAVGRPDKRVPVQGAPGVKSPAARSGRPAAVRAGSRQLAAGTGGTGTSKAQDAAGGLARLLFLAAFVTFAVYVLPYWGG
ncbi:hypothetical protein QFZ30_004011 [Arthrobacter pascens]|uniref:nuclease-related domain-containing protein n=1 Tax=Arthrobacter pascens TaxID=1677 RepID=UPI002790674A|nr:nuclease-related domain-containing protein [Arthrobacter pascens]MDQ0680629.1 hypothetical protein [Arthrobacter pascens]